ncbi:hypothetical protein THOM_1298, partial [Trachipleistophora hominis]
VQVDSELTSSDDEYDENVTAKRGTQECSWSANLEGVSTNHARCINENKSSTQTEDTRENIDTREDRCNQITHRRESVMSPRSNPKCNCCHVSILLVFLIVIVGLVLRFFAYSRRSTLPATQ